MSISTLSRTNVHNPYFSARDDNAAGLNSTRSSKPELTYRGGKILKNPSVASVYYGSYWNSAAGKADAKYETAFASYMSQSEYAKLWSEFGIEQVQFAGSSVVSPTITPKVVTDSKIKEIISKQIASGSVQKPDGETIYTVFLPPNTVLKGPGNSSSLDGLGGYHGSFDIQGKRAYYAAIVYSKDSNGIDFNGNARDNISIAASHEWVEAATDPDVNNGQLGWYDDNLGEIADIPINQGMNLADVFGRIGKYAVQKIWSNVDNRNEISAKQSSGLESQGGPTGR